MPSIKTTIANPVTQYEKVCMLECICVWVGVCDGIFVSLLVGMGVSWSKEGVGVAVSVKGSSTNCVGVSVIGSVVLSASDS